MRRIVCNSFSLALVLALALALRAQQPATPAAPGAGDEAALVLARFGIQLSVESIGSYLRGLDPGADEHRRVQELVEQLGDPDYFRRESAQATLLAMAVVPLDPLYEGVAGGDAEVRLRAKQILDAVTGQHSEVLSAALRTISIRKLKGVAAEVLAAIPHCRGESGAMMLASARDALRATVRLEDADRLRQAVGHRHLEVRAAVAEALGELLGAKSLADLKPLLADKEDVVKLAAARTLAKHGQRECLATLGALLESEQLTVRLAAYQTLRSLTDYNLPYVAYDDPTTRGPAAKKWQEWIAKDGQTARLNHPLKDLKIELGRTLYCSYQTNRVVELDAKGNEVWSAEVMNPWGCQGLPNGHRLVASYSGKFVVEFDANGTEVWRMTLDGMPFSVERLENGRTLIALYDKNRLIEVNRDKEIVSQIDVFGRAGGLCDAKRLPDGNTLVTLLSGRRVTVIDPAGKEISDRRISNLRNPRSASMLENGNILVCDTGANRVIEYDKSGVEKWSQAGLSSPFDAVRLADGSTLIADSTGLRKCDNKGNMTEIRRETGISRISRY